MGLFRGVAPKHMYTRASSFHISKYAPLWISEVYVLQLTLAGCCRRRF